MLDRLDDTDWSATHHAYGVATDVPRLLRAVADGDSKAVRDLFVRLDRKGSVMPAAVLAVPFVAELARAPIPARVDMVRLLCAIAHGPREARDAVEASAPAVLAELPADGHVQLQAALVGLAALVGRAGKCEAGLAAIKSESLLLTAAVAFALERVRGEATTNGVLVALGAADPEIAELLGDLSASEAETPGDWMVQDLLEVLPDRLLGT